MKPLI
jgi:hypothetical protein